MSTTVTSPQITDAELDALDTRCRAIKFEDPQGTGDDASYRVHMNVIADYVESVPRLTAEIRRLRGEL